MSLDTSAPPEPPAERGSLLGMAVVALGLLITLALVLVIGTVAVASIVTGDDEAEQIVESQLNIALTEFAIDGELTAPAGRVVLNISNEGAIEHNVAVRGTNTRSQMDAATHRSSQRSSTTARSCSS